MTSYDVASFRESDTSTCIRRHQALALAPVGDVVSFVHPAFAGGCVCVADDAARGGWGLATRRARFSLT
jgi:hypothetical protein